jgi:hypothetical protein
MKTWSRMVVVILLLLAVGSPAAHVCRLALRPSVFAVADAAVAADKVPSLRWEDLQLLDYKTGRTPQSLKKLDGSVVRIPGYIIPLEDNDQSVSEFLLVPYPLACIHVPAPPPNLIVHVKMDNGRKVPFDFYEPVWAQGRLKIERTQNIYTSSSYSMAGSGVEPYEYKK